MRAAGVGEQGTFYGAVPLWIIFRGEALCSSLVMVLLWFRGWETHRPMRGEGQYESGVFAVAQ